MNINQFVLKFDGDGIVLVSYQVVLAVVEFFKKLHQRGLTVS